MDCAGMSAAAGVASAALLAPSFSMVPVLATSSTRTSVDWVLTAVATLSCPA